MSERKCPECEKARRRNMLVIRPIGKNQMRLICLNWNCNWVGTMPDQRAEIVSVDRDQRSSVCPHYRAAEENGSSYSWCSAMSEKCHAQGQVEDCGWAMFKNQI